MKTFITSLALATLLLTGCTTTNPILSPALVQVAVQTGTAFGVEKYPQAVPAIRVAAPVVCAAANGTNVQPAEVVAALRAAGVSTNAEATVILNGAIAIYLTVFDSYGSAWVQNKPQLVLYLKAVCEGLKAGLPPDVTDPTARPRSAKALPPL